MAFKNRVLKNVAYAVFGLSLAMGGCSGGDQQQDEEDLQTEQGEEAAEVDGNEFESESIDQGEGLGVEGTELAGDEALGGDADAAAAAGGGGLGGALDGINEIAEAAQEQQEAEAAPEAAPAPSATEFNVTIRRGDTLSVLCARIYGIPTMYHQIASVNNIPNPNLIYPGQTFRFPVTNEASRAYAMRVNGSAANFAPAPQTNPEVQNVQPQSGVRQVVYTVRPGDTLSTIARTHFGSYAAWRTIYQQNSNQIANPNVIEVGQQLTFSVGHAH